MGKKVICKYENIEIGMPVCMEDLGPIVDAGRVRKGIRNCRKMEKQRKKKQYKLKQRKCMTIITGREKQKQIKKR